MQLIYFDRFVLFLKEMEMLPGTKCCRCARDRIYIHRFTRWKKVKQITESCLLTTEPTGCSSFSNKLLTNVVNCDGECDARPNTGTLYILGNKLTFKIDASEAGKRSKCSDLTRATL